MSDPAPFVCTDSFREFRAPDEVEEDTDDDDDDDETDDNDDKEEDDDELAKGLRLKLL